MKAMKAMKAKDELTLFEEEWKKMEENVSDFLLDFQFFAYNSK